MQTTLIHPLNRPLRSLVVLLLSVLLVACNEAAQEPKILAPVAFHNSDECHVCGMIISGFPGPKGEAVGQESVKKFCSTTEMLGWWLQPENQQLDVTLYVHDMARSDWNRPDDAHLINARAAYFVLAPDLPGAMGVTLASFGDPTAAQQMAESHAGQVLRLDDIDLTLLQQSGTMAHP